MRNKLKKILSVLLTLVIILQGTSTLAQEKTEALDSYGASFITSFLAEVASAGAIASGGTLTPGAYAAIGGAITALGNNAYQDIMYGELMETAYEEYFEVVENS